MVAKEKIKQGDEACYGLKPASLNLISMRKKLLDKPDNYTGRRLTIHAK
jgi:hypothetical protein